MVFSELCEGQTVEDQVSCGPGCSSDTFPLVTHSLASRGACLLLFSFKGASDVPDSLFALERYESIQVLDNKMVMILF